jgi:hypothetical protein
VSTTRSRVKYAIFQRDPRAQLLVDDSTAFRAIREKYGRAVPGDEEHLRALTAEGRILLAITPDQPLADWTCWSLD